MPCSKPPDRSGIQFQQRASTHCHNPAACRPINSSSAEWGSQTLRQACFRVKPESAMCVQNFDDSRGLAIRITYRISLRSSSLWEPRHPPLKVVLISYVSSGREGRRLTAIKPSTCTPPSPRALVLREVTRTHAKPACRGKLEAPRLADRLLWRLGAALVRPDARVVRRCRPGKRLIHKGEDLGSAW